MPTSVLGPAFMRTTMRLLTTGTANLQRAAKLCVSAQWQRQLHAVRGLTPHLPLGLAAPADRTALDTAGTRLATSISNRRGAWESAMGCEPPGLMCGAEKGLADSAMLRTVSVTTQEQVKHVRHERISRGKKHSNLKPQSWSQRRAAPGTLAAPRCPTFAGTPPARWPTSLARAPSPPPALHR